MLVGEGPWSPAAWCAPAASPPQLSRKVVPGLSGRPAAAPAEAARGSGRQGAALLAAAAATAALLPARRASAGGKRRQRLGRLAQFAATLSAQVAPSSAGGLFPDLERVAEDGMGDMPTNVEPSEPCVLLEVKGDVALVRTGLGLFTVVRPGALVEFSSGATGTLLVWKEGIGAIQLTSGRPSPGESCKSTGQLMTTMASADLRGRIINPLGRPVDGGPAPDAPSQPRLTFAEYKQMQERNNQYRALFTGVLGVDFSVPVGRGQTMLFQGTDPVKDRLHLWPDLMASKPVKVLEKKTPDGPVLNICVCNDMDAASKMREQLISRGCWDNCAVVVPSSPGPGGVMIAMNAAVAVAEHINDQDGEAIVLFDLEPMHRIWNLVAEAAGEERRAKGLMDDPESDKWTELEGTILRESIAERRKFWFALISRATNTLNAGSVSLLAWLWEQPGGLDHRRQKALELQIERIMKVPRIDDALRQKMLDKVKAEAQFEGPAEVGPEVPGVPNWEIEELKSISDGHVLLLKPDGEDRWDWYVDPYKSLPRLGTDALHPALISVEAHKLRLKMLQGRDRANYLHDMLGAPETLDKESLELRFVELLLRQPGGEPMSIEEQVARLVVVNRSACKPLLAPGCCNGQTLRRLAAQLLESEAGFKAQADILLHNEITEPTRQLLVAEIDGWSAA